MRVSARRRRDAPDTPPLDTPRGPAADAGALMTAVMTLMRDERPSWLIEADEPEEFARAYRAMFKRVVETPIYNARLPGFDTISLFSSVRVDSPSVPLV